jgi:hypothetical protein
MVVGQQTFWWPQGGWYRQGLGEDPVADIMALYDDFNLAATYSGHNSPFWAANHTLYAALNPGAPARGFLWSNLVKIDQHQRRPDPEIEESISRFMLLSSEIRICRPDVVVFFTGPEYESRLQWSFPGARIEGLNGSLRRLARVVHPGLPRSSFRTYHPNYLRRSGQWEVLHEVAQYAREA